MRTYLVFAAARWSPIRSETRVLVVDRRAPSAWIEPARQTREDRRIASTEPPIPGGGRTEVLYGPATIWVGGSDAAGLREIKAVVSNGVTGERTVHRFDALWSWRNCQTGIDARDDTLAVTCAVRQDFSNAPGRYDLVVEVIDAVGNRTQTRSSVLALPCPRPRAEDAWACGRDLPPP